MTTDMTTIMELADENKQNINLYSIIKKEDEDNFDNGYVENLSSFINIKDEIFESTATIVESESNDKRSLKTKKNSDKCNMNCQTVSPYCEDEQQISEFQLKEETEKMSDVIELDDHGEQNKNLYPVKLEDESSNNFINAKDELFEATETDIQTENTEFIKNQKTSNIQKSKGLPKYQWISGEESHNKHMVSHTNFQLADLRTCDSYIYMIHPDKNEDKLLVDEVTLHEQSVRKHVSEMQIIKKAKNMFPSKKIETDLTQSRFKLLNSVKSTHLRIHTVEKPFNCKITTAMTTIIELADENKQNINLDSIIKKEDEEGFDNGYLENLSSFVNIKDELFESTATIIESESNDKRSLKTKQISDKCNMNCHIVSTYCDDEQQISEFQVKEEPEKMSDVMELDDHGEQNKNLYSVKLEDESSNNFMNAKDELFEVTETDILSKNTEFIKNQKISNIQKSKGSPLPKYQWTSDEESHNKHKFQLADLRTCDSNIYIIHPDKNGDKLLVDEVALHEQSVRKDVSEMQILKESKNMFSSKKIETDQIQSRLKDNVLNSVKSTHLRTHTGEKLLNCEFCHQSFSQSGHLKKHLRTHTAQKPFKHKVCHKSLSESGHRKEHLSTHTVEKPFNCKVCNKSFSNSSISKMHLRTNTGGKPFNCEVCNKSFSHRGYLKQHLEIHSGEKLFKCKFCHKSFSANGTLNKHLRTHTVQKPFKCEVCHKSFLLSTSLRMHLRFHTGEKPFHCKVCHKSFSHRNNLKRHLRTHTGEKPFNCEVCHKSFSQRGHLKIHFKTHAEEKRFNCEVCYESFSQHGQLKKHFKTHTREKLFNCEVCHESFSLQSQLKKHFKTHTGEKSFNCEVCHKSFSLQSQLKKHFKTHTGEKPYNCEVCHKSFSRSSCLKIHLRFHTGEKPFICVVCHKSFSGSSSFKIHLRIHTGEKPFKCEVCHKSFSHSSNLKRHLRTHTGEKL